MAIYDSNRTISIKAPSVHCDSCGSMLDLIGELTSVKLERISNQPRKIPLFTMGGEGLFIIPGIPTEEADVALVAAERGWKRESIHGRTLDFCPGCQRL